MVKPEIINMSLANRRLFGKALFATIIGTIITPSSSLSSPILSVTTDSNSDLEKIKKILATKEPAVWLFTGDSITHGVKHTHGERSYPEIFQERVRYELGRYRDIVINTGISGHTTENLLKDFDWRIAHFKPAVVSIMIGTNDCAKEKVSRIDYRENLKTLTRKIREAGTVPIFHTPNNIIIEKAPERETLSEYVRIIHEVALEENLILVDNYKVWEESDQNTVHKEWLNDALHPNGNGHKQIALELFKTLDIFDPKYPTCGAPYYEGDH